MTLENPVVAADSVVIVNPRISGLLCAKKKCSARKSPTTRYAGLGPILRAAPDFFRVRSGHEIDSQPEACPGPLGGVRLA
ncbi:MAG: hypothetical protein ACYTA3_10595, partial [Planctomycetota bacterium]